MNETDGCSTDPRRFALFFRLFIATGKVKWCGRFDRPPVSTEWRYDRPTGPQKQRSYVLLSSSADGFPRPMPSRVMCDDGWGAGVGRMAYWRNSARTGGDCTTSTPRRLASVALPSIGETVQARAGGCARHPLLASRDVAADRPLGLERPLLASHAYQTVACTTRDISIHLLRNAARHCQTCAPASQVEVIDRLSISSQSHVSCRS